LTTKGDAVRVPVVVVGVNVAHHQLSERLGSNEVQTDHDGSRDAFSSLSPGDGLPYRSDYPLGERKDKTFENRRLSACMAIDRCRRAIHLRRRRIDGERFKTIA
jgi:hypothetical protein